uniref:Uncharacterized protein n=1 Tax=Arundo donax TaxID=35708 RepID=A0A0A9H6U6_ARUDO
MDHEIGKSATETKHSSCALICHLLQKISSYYLLMICDKICSCH